MQDAKSFLYFYKKDGKNLTIITMRGEEYEGTLVTVSADFCILLSLDKIKEAIIFYHAIEAIETYAKEDKRNE